VANVQKERTRLRLNIPPTLAKGDPLRYAMLPMWAYFLIEERFVFVLPRIAERSRDDIC
jgi:hypothetical protein